MRQDFGGGKWVKGRKQHRCEACFGPIPQGERHYHYRGMFEGDWQDWRMHAECYEAWHADGCGEFGPGDFPVPERLAVPEPAKVRKREWGATKSKEVSE